MITPRKKLSIENQIAKMKAALAADKRKWGGWDDSRGIRYMPPALYIQIEDWQGGLKYLKWFEKNFPDDMGMPDFLFEWMLILLRNEKIKEAEKKMMQVFFSNTYLLDAYLGKPIVPIAKWEGSNLASPEYLEYFNYNEGNTGSDITEWVSMMMESEQFLKISAEFIRQNIRLKTETGSETRHHIIAQMSALKGMFNV